jgi:hypothetical protein
MPVFSEVFDLKPTSGLYLKNSAHLSNFLTPRTVSAMSQSSSSSSSFVLDWGSRWFARMEEA